MSTLRTKIILAGGTVTSALGPMKQRWLPDELDADLLGWMRGDGLDTLTLNGSDEVTQWDSKVNAFSLTNQNGAAAKPVYNPTAWSDGTAALEFTAGTGLTTGTVMRGTGPLNDDGMMVFAAVKRGAQLNGTGVGIRPIVIVPATLYSAVRQGAYLGVWRPTVEAPQTKLTAGQHTGTIGSNSNVDGFDNGDEAIISGEYRNVAPYVQARMNAGAPGAAAGWFGTAYSQYYIGGANNSNDSQFEGLIKEVIVTKILSDADRFRVEGYLAWRCSLQALLPADHVYRNDGPYV